MWVLFFFLLFCFTNTALGDHTKDFWAHFIKLLQALIPKPCWKSERTATVLYGMSLTPSPSPLPGLRTCPQRGATSTATCCIWLAALKTERLPQEPNLWLLSKSPASLSGEAGTSLCCLRCFSLLIMHQMKLCRDSKLTNLTNFLMAVLNITPS